ncbi:unnamed protein product [Anisakis simplex]|uniref:Late endosomal/lysosomal adaptor and MAPK and MTOR activator 5 n=1 Tax=Anisakis simplex TaxID=6269 RepID=A0A0M3K1G2_ANISI|nr:unnamed protein product [Anisakis simplex]
MRLNTEFRQKSVEKRPQLSKAQSVYDPNCTPQSNESSGRELSFQQHSASTTSRFADSKSDVHSPRKDSPNSDTSEKVALPESITSLCFIHACCKKNDSRSVPCLWLGTSMGTCIAFSLLLPTDRLNSNVVVAPTGSIFRLKGQFLYTAFLDQSFCLLTAASESYRDIKEDAKASSASSSNNGTDRAIVNKVVTKCSLSPTFSNASESFSSREDDFSQICCGGDLWDELIRCACGMTISVHYFIELSVNDNYILYRIKNTDYLEALLRYEVIC